MANTTLGTLLIELKAKTDQFEKGMKSAKDLSFSTTSEIVSSLGKIGSQLMNMKFNGVQQAGRSVAMLGGIAAATGVALASSLIAVAVETSNKMIEMSHQAEKAGMDIKEFSENAYAAKRSGVAIDDFTNAMAKLAKTSLSAAQGNAQAQRALALAGTSATDSAGRLRSTGSILDDIIKKYDSLTDKTLKVGLAQQIFGRGGASLLPFLEKGRSAIEQYRKQAELLGVALDEKTVAAAKSFKGAINDYKAASEGATLQLTAGMLPAINQILDGMTKVTGKASAMREFGETIGEAFKSIAAMVYRAAYALEFWKIKFDQFKSPKQEFRESEITSTVSGLSNPGSAAAALQSSGVLDRPLNEEERKHFYDSKTTDPFKDRLDEANRKLQERLDSLDQPPSVKNTPEKPNVGATVSNPDSKNYAAEEIAKLREKASANSALAAAQLISERTVRGVTAANQADAIILQIATKASKEHKTSLDDEIASAQKKYRTDVLALTVIAENAQRNNEFNKSISEQIRDLNISADAHQRMADAIMQGGDATQRTAAFNEIDQMVRRADIVLTKEQRDALEKLRVAKQRDAETSANEAIARRTTELTNAARATQLLTAAIGNGTDAEIDARAQIEAENFAIQNNISLKDSRIAKMKEEIAANERASRNQQTSQGLRQDYDPKATYNQRIADIDAAVKENKNLTIYAEAAKRDAYLEEQEAIDALAMKTEKGAAGATVALREWLRESQNWAVQFHGAVTDVLQGFDTGFRNAFHDVIMGTKSVGQAFLEMGQTMVGAVVDALGRIVAKWIETKIIMATLKLFGVDMEQEDPRAKIQPQLQANVQLASSYAALAAAEEFQWKIAESGDIFSATAFAALTYGIGESFASLAAFDNGGIMPKTGIALVHQDEGVLTAPVTKMLKNMANSPKFNTPAPSSSGSRTNSRGDVHLHYSAAVQAIDTTDMKEKLSEHGEHIAAIVMDVHRNSGMEVYGV